MKKYSYTYRKRGLPESAELKGTVEAGNYHEAVVLASKQAGEDFVIINVGREENEVERLSEGNEQGDPQSHL